MPSVDRRKDRAVGAAWAVESARHESRELAGGAAKKFSGHIIVCGETTHLRLFVRALRSAELLGSQLEKPIVILHPDPIDDMGSEWEAITQMKIRLNDGSGGERKVTGVFYVRGDPKRSADLARAGINGAASFCLLAHRQNMTELEGESIDTETVLTFLQIEKKLPRDIYSIVELTCASNMGVLNSTVMRRHQHDELVIDVGPDDRDGGGDDGRGGEDAWFTKGGGLFAYTYSRAHDVPGADGRMHPPPEHLTPNPHRASQFSGLSVSRRAGLNEGGVSGPSTRSRTTSSIDRNNRLETAQKAFALNMSNDRAVLEESSGASSAGFFDGTEGHHMMPFFASGRGYVDEMFDTLLCQAYYNREAPLTCEQLLVGKSSGNLFQMPCPPEFVGMKFEDLYKDFLVNRRMVPIGLYRGPTEENEALQYYVYAVPRRSAELHETDRIFVFGTAAQLQKYGRVEDDAIETSNPAQVMKAMHRHGDINAIPSPNNSARFGRSNGGNEVGDEGGLFSRHAGDHGGGALFSRHAGQAPGGSPLGSVGRGGPSPPPLTEWQQCVADDGSVYYWNKATDETSFEKPAGRNLGDL